MLSLVHLLFTGRNEAKKPANSFEFHHKLNRGNSVASRASVLYGARRQLTQFPTLPSSIGHANLPSPDKRKIRSVVFGKVALHPEVVGGARPFPGRSSVNQSRCWQAPTTAADGTCCGRGTPALRPDE